jgi:hypothetical protein
MPNDWPELYVQDQRHLKGARCSATIVGGEVMGVITMSGLPDLEPEEWFVSTLSWDREKGFAIVEFDSESGGPQGVEAET